MLAGGLTGLVSVSAAIYLPGLPLAAYSVLLFFVGFGGGCMAVSYAAAREHNAGGGTGAALGFVNMMAVVIKMLMRHMFNIKYVMETPWINI